MVKWGFSGMHHYRNKNRYYVKCYDYMTMVFSQRCLCLLLFHHMLKSHVLRGRKIVLWTRIWWMSHESESVRAGPYGLKLLQAIWMVSLPLSLSLSLSLSGWSIIFKVHKNIVFTQFHINQSQLNKWVRAELGNLGFFSYQHPRNGKNINNSLARRAADHSFPKQHIYATESRRLANGRGNPTETSCEG